MGEHSSVIGIINRKVTPQHTIEEFMLPHQLLPRKQHSEEDGKTLLELNVSGQPFIISSRLVKKYPDGKLANLEKQTDKIVDQDGSWFFDRDPMLFNAVLNLYRYDRLVYQERDQELIKKELRFWNLPESVLADTQDFVDDAVEKEFAYFEYTIAPPISPSRWQSWQSAVWAFMMDPLGPYTKHHKLALAYALFFVLLTFVYMIVFGLSTSMAFRVNKDTTAIMTTTNLCKKNSTTNALHNPTNLENYIQTVSPHWITITTRGLTFYFVFDSLMRFIFCPCKPVFFKSVLSWLELITTGCAISITLLVNAVDCETMGTDVKTRLEIILQSTQVLRLLRIFQYATLIDGLAVMLLTIKASIQELLLLVTYLLIGMFLFSTLIMFIELDVDSEESCIKDCLYGYWWAIITMTTVGYGDFYPVTVGGYVIGAICAICGIILTALPVAVIGRNFNVYWEHNKKRKQAIFRKIVLQDKT